MKGNLCIVLNLGKQIFGLLDRQFLRLLPQSGNDLITGLEFPAIVFCSSIG